MKKHVYILICMVLISYGIKGQTNTEDADKFNKAEEYYDKKEYSNALPLYIELLKTNSNNSNLFFKTGVCYQNDLNINQTRKSITYLEKAALNVDSAGDKKHTFDELSCPPEVFFALGKAYRINCEFDKAMTYLQKYKAVVKDKKNPNLFLANKEIQNVINAKAKFLNPIDFSLMKLENILDFPYDIDNFPVLSKDEKVLVYTMGAISNLMKTEDHENQNTELEQIFFSRKVNDKWTPPMDISDELNFSSRTVPVSLSRDGHELFLVRDDYDNGNIYSSTYDGIRWSNMKKLNKNINTGRWESHACIANNDKTLYFTSERKGGYGNLDIYKSDRDEKGDWGPAKNLGPNINTKFNEDMPFYFDDDNQLFFCSQGHYSLGGFDLFSAKYINSDSCSLPFNFGQPINSPLDDYVYILRYDSNYIFFPVYINVTSNKNYNCFIVNKSERAAGVNTKEYSLNGKLSFDDTLCKSFHDLRIALIDSLSSDTLNIITPYKVPGKYSIDLMPGLYKAVFIAAGCEKIVLNIKVPSELNDGAINYNVRFKPVPSTTLLNMKMTDTNNKNIDTVMNKRNLSVDQNYNLSVNATNNKNNVPKNSDKGNESQRSVVFNDNVKNPQHLIDKFTVRNIYFDYDDAELNSNSLYELNRIVNLMRTFPDLTLTINGFTDSMESDNKLPDERASAALDFILNHTITRNRVEVITFFRTGYIAINGYKDNSDSPDGRQFNRRVEFSFKNVDKNLILKIPDEVPNDMKYQRN